MKIDCLVAEIGSTTTVVNAFNLKDRIEYLGKGMYQTTVDTDVNIGLRHAIEDLRIHLKADVLTYDELFASSSAAGGLKITVHGLVYEMTAKAAKEAALGAGANIHLITANRLEPEHLEKIKLIEPNMIIIAGGTDYGEKEIAYHNLLDVIEFNIPLIYTGNIANHDRIKKLNHPLIKIVDNVYPRVDDFNILPLREAIYETFEKNIIHAKGMQHIFSMVNGTIIPTPGAVMDATMLLDEIFDGVMTIDVGGATTDVHTSCDPKPIYQKYSDGEPRIKRTVEGDLGVFVNRHMVLNTIRDDEVVAQMQMTKAEAHLVCANEPYIPASKEGLLLNRLLTKQCVELALDRHIGDLRRVFTTNGFKVIPEGKDTSLVKAVFLTGGALLYTEFGDQIIRDYIQKRHNKLVPSPDVRIYKDNDYIFASLGVLSHKYPEAAKVLLKQTIRFEE